MKLKDIVKKVEDDQRPSFARRKWQIEKIFRAKQAKTNSPKTVTDTEHDMFPYKIT